MKYKAIFFDRDEPRIIKIYYKYINDSLIN